MGIQNQIIDNSIIIYANKSIYSKDAIVNCTYWYTDNFIITIDEFENTHYKIILKLDNTKKQEMELDKYLAKFQKDLIDFNLRDIVSKETKNIRELLIAKAFSHFKTEEIPPEDEEQ